MLVSSDSFSRWLTPAISGQYGEGWLPPATRLGDLAVAGAAVFERIRVADQALRCRELAVPLAACRDGRVLMDQFPAVLSPFEAVSLPHHDVLGGTALEHDVCALHRADDAHVPVDRCVQFEDVDLAGLEVGEGVVEQLPRRRNTPRRERGNVEPQHVWRPVPSALRTGHRLRHLANDG